MNTNKYQHHAQITKLPVTTVQRYLTLYRQHEIARETRNQERIYLLGIDLSKMHKAYPQLRRITRG